jgi:hypothetical protein
VATCFFVPIAEFAAVAAALSFSLRYSSAPFAWLIAGICFLASGAMCYQAFVTFRKRWKGDATREPFWYVYLAAMMCVAWGFGFYLGQLNFSNNTLPYEDLFQLSSHRNVDPATMPGRQLMDAGEVTFVEGVKLDLTKAIGFKNFHQYCAAPIVHEGVAPAESYDYWAVGLDCCTGSTLDFHCGAYNNKKAHAGIRLMRADQRTFFRLAVQQAEATYDIKALDPLFFFFVEDALSELNSYKTESYKYFVLGLCSFSMFQLMAMVLGIFAFMKL